MRIKIKAKQVEIEYEEDSGNEQTSYFFMTGKDKKGDFGYTEKYMECLQKLIDGVEQLLEMEE